MDIVLLGCAGVCAFAFWGICCWFSCGVFCLWFCLDCFLVLVGVGWFWLFANGLFVGWNVALAWSLVLLLLWCCSYCGYVDAVI